MQRTVFGVALFAWMLVGHSGGGLSESVSSQASPASRLHQESLVIDGHVHIINRVFYEGIDPWKVQVTGLQEYARSKQGGVDAVIEHLYVDDGYNNYNVAVKQALRLIETFYRVLEANRDKMELALTSADVRRIAASGKLAVILAIEGSGDMEGDLDVYRLFHRLGVRMIQIVNHNTTNAYADSCFDVAKWGGITAHGRALISEMNRLGMIVDISHASEAAQVQMIEASAAPVAASHQSMRKFSSWPQNLPDAVLKAMSAKGGVAGMHSSATPLSQKFFEWSTRQPRWPFPTLTRSPDQDYGQYITQLDAAERLKWLNGQWKYSKPWRELTPSDAPPLPTVQDWVDQVDYMVRLVGPGHAALGLDMMDGGRNLRNFDATSYPQLTEAMLAKGLGADTIRKILGENWLRLLDAAKVREVVPSSAQ